MKKVKGFTLIELVIVMLIMGILAVTMTPNMISRIQKSKYDSAQSRARSIFNSAQTIVQKYESIDRAITIDPGKKLLKDVYILGNVSITPSPYTADDPDSKRADRAKEIYDKLAAMNTHLNDGKWILVIQGYKDGSVSNYKVLHVLWSAGENDNYVGVYCGCGESSHNYDFDEYMDNYRQNIVYKWNDSNSKFKPTP